MFSEFQDKQRSSITSSSAPSYHRARKRPKAAVVKPEEEDVDLGADADEGPKCDALPAAKLANVGVVEEEMAATVTPPASADTGAISEEAAAVASADPIGSSEETVDLETALAPPLIKSTEGLPADHGLKGGDQFCLTFWNGPDVGALPSVLLLQLSRLLPVALCILSSCVTLGWGSRSIATVGYFARSVKCVISQSIAYCYNP
jgi:hypothetical protein